MPYRVYSNSSVEPDYSNVGFFISDGGSEDIYIVVYAANLPDSKESQTYKINMYCFNFY